MVKSLEDGKTVAVSPSSPSETKKSNNVVQVEASQQDHLNKEKSANKQGKWQDIEAKLNSELADKTEKVASLQQELEKQKLEKQAVMDNKESKSATELNEKNKKISTLQEELDKERVGRKDDKNKIAELENKLKISNLKENKLNPVVFFDISIGGSRVGRVIMELFADIVPKTAENFRALCTGEKGNGRKGNLKPLHYKGSSFHLAFPQSWIVGGDITAGDGTGGESIYGGNFPLENFVKKHSGPGILSMMTNSSGTNGSQFYIWMKKAEYQDGRDVVFGQVVEGMDVIWAIDKAGSGGVISTKKVVIEDCGQLI